jgi:hypothetical protein
MGKTRAPQNSLYGTPNPLQGNLYPNIVTKRDPTVSDTGYQFGQIWVNTVDGNCFILTQVNSGSATWVPVGGGTVAIEALQGNTGGPVYPIGGIVDVVGSGNITTSGFGNSIVITEPSFISHTVNTTDATPTTIFSLSLGGVPATWAINVDIICLNTSVTDGAGFNVFGLMVTDGTSATEIQSEVGINLYGPTLTTATVTLTASGNDVVLQVVGVAATNITWNMTGNLREVD